MLEPVRRNQDLYDRLWARLPIPHHETWPIWPELRKELGAAASMARSEEGPDVEPRLLELGSGVLPRIPVAGGYFADLSQAALRKLADHGGRAVRSAGALPFADQTFKVICAFEVLEHIPDDDATIAEIARVLMPGGALFFSVPVDPTLFTGFDTACGHVRRYDAAALERTLLGHGLVVERWTTQPNNFGKRMGDFVGRFLEVMQGWPRVMIWLKQKGVASERRLRYEWRTGDIRQSHAAGGLIAIARKPGQFTPGRIA